MFKKVAKVARKEGFAYAFIYILSRILRVDIGVRRAKNKAWKVLFEKHKNIIAYGPFKGMKLNKNIWWSKNDRITQTLGIYEEHILDKLIEFQGEGAARLIDVGAADGYFAVGMAYAGIYKEVFAFEIEKKGQERIIENAAENHCQSKIKVQGEANHSSIQDALDNEKISTVLIDIEGAEYRFLDDEMLKLLSGNFVICELHPWASMNGNEFQNDLLSRSSKYFNLSIIKREYYNPNHFQEFEDFSDDERLIAVSEGRRMNTSWMVLTPK